MRITSARRIIEQAGVFACLMFLFSSCLSIALQNISLGLAGAAALAHLIVNGPAAWRRKSPEWSLRALLLFIGAALLSTAFANNSGPGMRYLPTLLLLTASPLAFIPFAGSRLIDKWGIRVLAAGLVLGEIVMFFRGVEPHLNEMRYHPFMGIMNYAGALGLAYPVFLALLLHSLKNRGDRRRQLLLALMVVAVFVGILFNGTRIIFLSACGNTLLLLLLNLGGLRKRLLFLIAVLIAATCVFATAFPNESKRANLNLDSLTKNSSNKVRLELWKDGIGRLGTLPVFGIGLANTPGFNWTPEYDFISYDHSRRGHYHNTFLHVTVEMGFPGLLTLCGLFVPSVILALKRIRSSDARQRLWAQILIALIAAFAMHSLTDTVFFIKSTIYFLALLLAICWTRLLPSPPEPDAMAA